MQQGEGDDALIVRPRSSLSRGVPVLWAVVGHHPVAQQPVRSEHQALAQDHLGRLIEPHLRYVEDKQNAGELGENAELLGLTGRETYTIEGIDDTITARQALSATASILYSGASCRARLSATGRTR